MKGKRLAIAFTYIGAVVGAGFASGREIWLFFARYQGMGFLGILLVGLFLVFLAPFLFLLGKKLQIASYQDFFYHSLPGPVAFFFDFVYSFFLLGSVAVMLAGSGAIFKESIGWPAYYGSLITIFFILGTLYQQKTGLFLVNSLIVPVLLLITLIMVIKYLGKIGTAFLPFFTLDLGFSANCLRDALLYAAYNLSMAVAAMSKVVYQEEEKDIFWGGFWGGAALLLLSALIYFTLLAAFHSSPQEEIPLLFVAQSGGKAIYLAYLIAIYFAMLSTALVNYYAFTQRLVDLWKIDYHSGLILPLFLILPFLGFSFSHLVAKLYPLYGYLGILIVVYYLYLYLGKDKEF